MAYFKEHAHAETGGTDPEEPAAADSVDEYHTDQGAGTGADVVNAG